MHANNRFDQLAATEPTSGSVAAERPPPPLPIDWLRRLCLECGADDVGFVALERPELADERPHILHAFPKAKALISLVLRLNPEPIRSPARGAGNLEFHQTTDRVNEVTRAIVTRLGRMGIPALNPSAGFPMDMDRFPGRVWIVSHKVVAEAAGLGKMGLHRCVIHPTFGSHILVGTVLLGAELADQSAPIDFNPCFTCRLCVAACPVGAIHADGHFDFSACATHNYREFMSGFTDWVRTVADSRDGVDYGRRVRESESASMWQSLAFGPNYKAAYCIAVCPAGEEVIPPFRADRAGFLTDVVRPLQKREEPIYVTAGSDAADHVATRFPHKEVRLAHGIRPTSIDGFLFGMKLVFQRGKAKGLNAVYHLTFTGREQARATVTIRDETLAVEDGHVGSADLAVTADSRWWIEFIRGERWFLTGLLTRRVKLRGPLRLMLAFGRCFPS
jgi:NAD-dependent dihydropyrimidine dehydrogenase PreA subunit